MAQVGGGGHRPDSPGGGDGGFPGGGGLPQIAGVARDLALSLSLDRSTLNMTLTPNDESLFTSNVTYAIYWLNPAIFSQNDVYGQPQGTVFGQITGNGGVSLIQGRQFVTAVNGGAGVVSATVPYIPYVSGGWMYAVVVLANTTREYRLNGTNFVPVPPLDAAGQPIALEKPVNVNVTWASLNGSATNRLVQFGWNNGKSLTSVAYVQILIQNYFNDGFTRELALFKVNTGPGARQGIPATQGANQGDASMSIVLERDDLVGHNITWVFQPLTSAYVGLDIASCSNVVTLQIA